MLVTFCGHSQISDHTAVSAALRRVILDLIHEGADEFYLGGYGEFDSLAVNVNEKVSRALMNF